MNEIFRKRASSYGQQIKSRENALKMVEKRWQSCSEKIEEEESPSKLVDLLQRIRLNPPDLSIETLNEPENLRSQILRFFDYSGQILIELMKH